MASAPHSYLSVARHRGDDPPPHSSEKSTRLPSLLNVTECHADMLVSATAVIRRGFFTSEMSSRMP